MAKLSLYKINSSKLSSLPISEGQFIITTDDKRIYLDDAEGQRIPLYSDEIDKLSYIANNATKVETSTKNGYIKIDGVEVQVYTAPADVNTTYKISKSGNTITLTGSDGSTSTVTDSNTTYSNMTGSSTTSDGSSGLVPAPTRGNSNRYLSASGTWTVPENTTYNNATQSSSGLMSSTDKTKLDGVEEGAQVNTVTGVKGSSETSYRTGDINITKANIGLGNVENKSSATIRGELTKANVTTALGYTPPQQDTNTTYGLSLVGDTLSLVEGGSTKEITISTNDTTYTLTQDSTDGHRITLTPSTGEAQTITIPDNNTKYGLNITGNRVSLVEGGTTTSVTVPDNNTTYSISNNGSSITLTPSSGNAQTITVPDTNTTYTISASGRTITLTPSSGDAQSVTIPDNNTKYGLSITGNTVKLVEGGTTSSITVPDNNTTYTLTQDSTDGHKITLTPSTGNPTTITIPDNNTTYGVASASSSGLMSAADKKKLDGIAEGATNTVDTNTTYTLTQDSKDGHKITLTPSTGSPTTITIPDNNTTYNPASQTTSGLMSASDKKKLDGIAEGATNTTDTTYTLTQDSANGHKLIFTPSTGSATTITIPDNNTTYSAGTGISLSGTTFNNSGVRSIATGSSNGTISVNTNGTTANVAVKGLGSLAYKSSLSASDVGAIPTSAKGAANGVATLDASGLVPASQLPSFVDDVIEGYYYNSKFYKESGHTTEIASESGKIYVDLSTNKTYRWSGSAYAVISDTLALGTTSSTAFRGDYGNTAYTHSQKTSGNPHKVTKSDVGLGNVDNTADANKSVKYAATAGDATTVSGHTVAKDVPSNAVFTDTNTWVKASTTADGYISKLSGNTSQYLRGDGTWATPPNTNTTYSLTQDSSNGHIITLTPSSGNAQTITIPDNNTTYTFGQGSTNGTISVTPSGGSAKDVAVKGLGTVAYINKGTSTSTYLRNDGTWATPPNTNTIPSAICTTAAGTAAKTASCSNYVLLAKSYIQVIIGTSNSSQTALTLNINGTGAKNIYINGSASSTSNYTLPAGSYLVYYDGTNFYFRTDGKITGDITGNAATVNGLTVQTAVPANAKFTDTNTTYSAGAGISLSGTTFSNSGVRSIATGSSNGTISVNTNGTSTNVAVKGLGSWAYKSSGSYSDVGLASAITNITRSGTTFTATKADGSTFTFTQQDNNTWTAFKGATSSAAGTAGYVPAPSSGQTGLYFRSDGTWATPTNTTYNVMGAATSSAAGKSGLVPAPAAGKQTSFLRGDGTWVVPTNTTYNVATHSSNGLMSSGDKTKLDGIATGATANSASSTTPKAAGTAAVGSETSFARGDHVHPAQTTVSGNAGSATKLQNARTIDGMSFNGTAAITAYGTCGTDAATAAKVVSCSNFTLITGSRIIVKFTVTNTAAVANLTLNVNNTGAKAIKYRNGNLPATSTLTANRVYEFIYDGTNYQLVGDLDTNTNTTYSAGTGLSLSGTKFSLASGVVTAGSKGPTANVTGSNGATIKVPKVTVDTYGRVTGLEEFTFTAQNTNTNYYPTKFAWTNGTTSGPTGSLTGSGMSAVSFGAIPAANGTTASGIVTTGAQTFGGVKTFASAPKLSTNTITTSGGYTVTIPNATATVATTSTSQALTNKTYNGYTLGAACAKGVDTSMTTASTSTNVPTTAAVASLVKNLSGCSTQATSLTCTLPDNL